MSQTQLQTLANTVAGLIDAGASLTEDAPNEQYLQAIVQRGKFRPTEDEAIGYWFARFLTVREALWRVIDDVLALLEDSSRPDDEELRYFVIGYGAACVLVGIDRVLLFKVAKHSVIQRKLNEPFQELRIPRKQFTRVFEAFVDESGAFSLLDAMRFAKKHRRRLRALQADPVVGPIARRLPEIETALNPSLREYLRGAWAYVSHKWRRRGVVSVENALAGVMEGVGRAASELYQADNKRVTETIRKEAGQFLRPGDVIVTRHAIALTNLFMPGFWPHVALYVGTEQDREALGVELPGELGATWTGDICTLEALKDGVRLRPLSDTLAVDYFAVLRPRVPAETIRRAIERGIVHEGKLYNFDFDFFSSDRLVCTEVIYRSFDGLDDIEFPLTERAGRQTLSAEDLLDFALEKDVFDPVAIFGVEGCEERIVYGTPARNLLIASYRTSH